jgi:GntR family transcriptional regulator of arabinose operon
MNDECKTAPRSLVRQSADLIRERIEAGQLGPSLPGENELARKLDVSRPTIREALGLLEQEAVVAAATTGVARQVKAGWFGRNKAGPTVRILLAAPLHERSAGFQAGMRQLRERLASHGAAVVFQVSPAFRTNRPQRILAKETVGSDCDVWVVVDATPQIEAWLEARNLPCVCVGGSYRHHLPRTGGEGDQAIRDAAKSLLALGHRRIVYPLHNAYGVQMVAAFREVLTEHGVQWDEAYHAPHWKDHAANFFPMLGRMFASAKPPTAFLTLGVRNLLPVLTWLGHHGLRVPEDVSLISMIDDPLLEFLYPQVTTYILDRDKVCHAAADLALRVARSGKPFDQARMIPMRRIEGRSTGPAQGR